MTKTLVVIPTYNERDNIKNLLKAINNLKIAGLEVLVVDDSSPDGTSEVVRRQIGKPDSAVHLLTRDKKEGLGKAYRAGFAWAAKRGYDFIVSMDADFSHRPEDLMKLVNVGQDIDVVIGSRYIRGGKIVGWQWPRYVNSIGANLVTRLLLGLKPKDVTAGFKRYSRRFIDYLLKKSLVSSGYAFQVETIFYAEAGSFLVKEVPIIFEDRRVGQSKISGELWRSAKIVFRLFLKRAGIRQFVKFSIVGFANFVLDAAAFTLLRRLAVFPELAKALSFTLSATSSYYLNRRWTFRSQEKEVVRQYLKFIAVALVGLTINTGAFALSFRIGKLSEPVSFVLATGAAVLWNFFANKFWTFKTQNVIK